MRIRFGVALVLLAGLASMTVAQIVPGEAPVEVRIPVVPVPAHVNGHVILAYELYVTNLLPREIRLNRIEVFGGGTASKPVVSYDEKNLITAIRQDGVPSQPVDTRKIPAGLRIVVYMWIAIDESIEIPRTLRHRLSFSVSGADGKQEDRYLDIAGPAVSRLADIVISPPLGNGMWVAGNGPSEMSIHRRAGVLAGGRVWLPERFAIDWVKVADNGKASHDDPKINANWYGYGNDVLAVANGIVTAVKDGIPENVPLSPERAVPISIETLGGNYVMLDLGNHRIAFYAHLQPGSLRVKPGEHVRRGQPLGLLGNSGNSDAPHLHFHISDDSSLASEGLPFVFESFETLGTVQIDKVLTEGLTLQGTKPEKHSREIPAENAAVRFLPAR